MRFILLLSISATILLSLSSLPYNKLNSELLNAKNILNNMQDISELILPNTKYVQESNKLKDFADKIIFNGDIDKDEKKQYLNKLRRLDRNYEGLLLIVQNTLRQYIVDNNYKKFLNIVNNDLPRFFDKKSFQHEAISYYKINAKFEKSKVMERELENYKMLRLAKIENELAQRNLEKKRSYTEKKSDQNIQILNQLTPKQTNYKNTNTRYLTTSTLTPSKYLIRKKLFTKWMSKREYQDQFYNGYYKKTKTYPAYIETNNQGQRRVLKIRYEPQFYWAATSGRLFKDFKKLHIKRTMNGKKLLTLHILKVDGIKMYTGIWISEEYFSREAKKLLAYGIFSAN